MDQTLDYYNKNAEDFASGTATVDFSETQNRFLKELPDGAWILDFGCGSGRDTKYFLSKGFQVEATDGSEELVISATALTGIEVKQRLFQELDAIDKYDGIWACASILHLAKSELKSVMEKMRVALKENGVIYTSFKYGENEGVRNGRYFTDFTEDGFSGFLADVRGLTLEEHWITGDVRPGREDEKWLNVILRKSGIN